MKLVEDEIENLLWNLLIIWLMIACGTVNKLWKVFQICANVHVGPDKVSAAIGLIANLEYRGNIYCKMFKNTDWRGKTKPIMAQLPFLHSTNIPQA